MKRTRLTIAFLLLVAFLLRLGGAVYWTQLAEAEGRLFRLGDSHSYWVLAGQIAQGLPYEHGSSESKIFRAPLYPLLIAPLRWIPEPSVAVWWTRVLGCGLGTLAVGLLSLLANRLGGPRAAIGAAAIGAVYPSAIGMSVVVLSEAVFMPLMVGYILLWQQAWSAVNNKQLAFHSGFAGAIAGMAVLARPSWLLFLPFALALGLLLGGQRKRHGLIFAFSLLGLCLVMSPWWIRNAWITGHFVPTTLQVGPSLYDGLHAGATGASDEGMKFMDKFLAEQRAADQQVTPEQLHSTLEYRLNARAQRAAVEWTLGHPMQALALAFRKFVRTWSFWPDGGDVGSTPVRLAIGLSSACVLLLAGYVSLRVLPPMGWRWGICWLPCLYFTLLHMVFVGSVRYREPALFLLVAVAACALGSMLSHRAKHNTSDASTASP